MNKRALSLVFCTPSDPAPSSRMSAGAVSQWASGGANGSKQAQSHVIQPQAFRNGSQPSQGISGVSVHPRSTGPRGYRSLAATGQLLGVSEAEVRTLIAGPLVGRLVGGELLVHSDDLDAYLARPRLFAVGA